MFTANAYFNEQSITLCKGPLDYKGLLSWDLVQFNLCRLRRVYFSCQAVLSFTMALYKNRYFLPNKPYKCILEGGIKFICLNLHD